MPKKPNHSEDEIAAFHQAMKGTQPLIHNKTRLVKAQRTRKVVRSKTADYDSFTLHDLSEVGAVTGEEFISYKQEGISNKTLRKLRKGQYNVDAILDLHGMSVEKAMTAVERFLQQCSREGNKIVLIIHGKGHHSQEPILKNKLNHWLRQIDLVLAFCSAAPMHGSRGASYVLLKSIIEENTA